MACEAGLTDTQAELLEAIASALTGVDVDYRARSARAGRARRRARPARSRPTGSGSCTTWCWASWCCDRSPSWSRTASRSTPRRSGVKDDSCGSRAATRRARTGWPGWICGATDSWTRPRVRGGDDGHADAPALRDRASSTRARGAVGTRSRSSRPGRSGARSGRCTTGAALRCPGRRAARRVPRAARLRARARRLRHEPHGEIEVFAFIGRADPDPKGFAWLATLIGLFETGYIVGTGFFDRDVRERHVQAPGMHQRLADGIRRGKWSPSTPASTSSTSTYYDSPTAGRRGPRDARRTAEVGEARSRAVRPASSTSRACRSCSSGSPRNDEESIREPEFHPDDDGAHATTPRR